MPKDIIEVIDTAVKIGLGALISGVTTYIVTNKSHRNTKEKLLIEKKVNILEYSVESIEPYFNAISYYLSRIDGAIRIKPDNAGVPLDNQLTSIFQKADDDLTEARIVRNIAISRLKLIGANDITNTLNDIRDIENDIRQIIIFDKMCPTIDQLNEFGYRFSNERNKFYESLEAEFIDIHC